LYSSLEAAVRRSVVSKQLPDGSMAVVPEGTRAVVDGFPHLRAG